MKKDRLCKEDKNSDQTTAKVSLPRFFSILVPEALQFEGQDKLGKSLVQSSIALLLDKLTFFLMEKWELVSNLIRAG